MEFSVGKIRTIFLLILRFCGIQWGQSPEADHGPAGADPDSRLPRNVEKGYPKREPEKPDRIRMRKGNHHVTGVFGDRKGALYYAGCQRIGNIE